jgi:hypothetical protein
MTRLIFAPALPADIVESLRAHPQIIKIQELVDKHSQLDLEIMASYEEFEDIAAKEQLKEEEYQRGPAGNTLCLLISEIERVVSEENKANEAAMAKNILGYARSFLYGEPVGRTGFNHRSSQDLQRQISEERNKMTYALYPNGHAPSRDALVAVHELEKRQKNVWMEILECTNSLESFVWVVRN